MRSHLATGFGVAVAVYRETRETRVSLLAASIAYYSFVSFLPLVLLALTVATAVGEERVTDAVIGATESLLTSTGQALLAEALTNVEAQSTVTVLGVVLLGWGALKLFRGLDAVFSEVYESGTQKSVLSRLRDALAAFGAVALGAAAVVALGGLVPILLSRVPFGGVVSLLAIVPALTVVFLPMYVVFPDAGVSVRDALPGAALAATGWAILAVGFRVFVEGSSRYPLYGALGAAVLFVTWLYFASIIIVLGAVTNEVLGRGPDGDEDGADREDEEPGPAPDIADLQRDVRRIETRLEEKTVSRSELEGDLRSYVRRRIRRGHARGWGPYLVLLYGTAMTLGAFYWLEGGWSILAMIVVWLSTLGLYVLMVLAGIGFNALSVPGRAVEWIRSLRS